MATAMAAEKVEAPAGALDLLLARLQERRIAVEKEVLKYGEAPAGIKEVFELCRGFERAYTTIVNESPVASKIKEAFMGDKGLAGTVKALPMDKVFELQQVKKVTRTADGYQPHLVSPEGGMRELADKALTQVAPPVAACTNNVFTLLVNAAREAAEKAGQHTESALMGSMPMVVPDFKNVVMPAVIVALEEWKKEAEKMSSMLVDMERSYITAGFFRHAMHQRSAKIKQQVLMADASRTATTRAAAGPAPGPGGVKSFFPAFGAAAQPNAAPGATPPPAANGMGRQQVSDAGSEGSNEEPGTGVRRSPSKDGTTGGAFNAGDMSDPNSFLAATLEKYGANDNNFMSMTSGLKWQKRFFIFSEAQRMLYYFKNTDEVGKGASPRGAINLVDTLVEDIDSQVMQKGGTPPLLLRIRHKNPQMMVHKDSPTLVLRAESLEQKMQWLARLRAASEPRRAPPPPKAANDKTGEEGQQGQPISSFGGSFANMMDDMSWAKDAEPIMDNHLGEGSAAFRADQFRDREGRLLPAPSVLINPMRLTAKARTATGAAAFEARHDAIMEQFGSDMSLYTRMVCDTVVTTVPKAIVHCMIRKSEKNLLERLFTVIHHLTPNQLGALLKEDEAVVQKRKEARAALEDCKSSIFLVQQTLERRNMTAPADRSDTVLLPTTCWAYAGMPELLTKEQRQDYDKQFSTPHAPESMRNWKVPPPVRALPGARAAPPPNIVQQAVAMASEATQGVGRLTGVPAAALPPARSAAPPGAGQMQGQGAPGQGMRLPPGVPPPGMVGQPGRGMAGPPGQPAAMGPPMMRRAPPPPPGR